MKMIFFAIVAIVFSKESFSTSLEFHDQVGLEQIGISSPSVENLTDGDVIFYGGEVLSTRVENCILERGSCIPEEKSSLFLSGLIFKTHVSHEGLPDEKKSPPMLPLLQENCPPLGGLAEQIDQQLRFFPLKLMNSERGGKQLETCTLLARGKKKNELDGSSTELLSGSFGRYTASPGLEGSDDDKMSASSDGFPITPEQLSSQLLEAKKPRYKDSISIDRVKPKKKKHRKVREVRPVRPDTAEGVLLKVLPSSPSAPRENPHDRSSFFSQKQLGQSAVGPRGVGAFDSFFSFDAVGSQSDLIVQGHLAVATKEARRSSSLRAGDESPLKRNSTSAALSSLKKEDSKQNVEDRSSLPPKPDTPSSSLSTVGEYKDPALAISPRATSMETIEGEFFYDLDLETAEKTN